MLLRKIQPKTIFGKLFLYTIAIFFLSFLLIYYGTSLLLKEKLENSFKKKSEAETQLLTSYISYLIKNYNYTAIYTLIDETVNSDPDIVGIRLKEYSSNLIEVMKTKKLKKCNNNLLEPCYYTVESDINYSVPIKVEILFSTENLVNLIWSVRELLIAFLILLFLLSELTIFVVMRDAEKTVSQVVEAIDRWRTGGIEKLKGKSWSSEIEKIVSEVIEMYTELQREREIDYKLLLFTGEVLNILSLAKDEKDFLEKILPLIKTLFKVEKVEICREKPCDGENEIPVGTDKKISLSKTTVPETVLKTVGNIISGALKVLQEKKEREELLFGTVKAIANAIDATSPWTKDHSEKVAEISVEIGKALGLDDEELEKLRLGALLHDIGKLGIPPEILNKPEKLTPEEYEIVKEHPVWGYRILKPIKAFSDIIPIVLYHHERCDGRGYPEGLKCSQIPPLAKIVAVADVIEAMTAERPYKKPYPLDEVFDFLKSESGRQFSPEVVEAALRKKEKIKEIISGRGGGI